jgi:hypothetical protein
MESIKIKGFTFVQTHESCPERYDVRDAAFKRVAYVELNCGYLTCRMNDAKNELIYEEELDDTMRQDSFANGDQRAFCLNNIADTIVDVIAEERIASEPHREGMVYNLDLRFGKEGYFVDGRHFCITSIPSIMACSDGTIKYADISVQIDGIYHTMRVDEFVKNIKTIGNLTVR